jgi:hypothetical protein
MVAAKNWCNLFGQSPAAGVIAGTAGNNEYKVGCPSQLRTIDVDDAVLFGKCGGGQQHSPACRTVALNACQEQAGNNNDKVGFYVAAAGSGKTKIACAPSNGDPRRGPASNTTGCDSVLSNLNAPVPIACTNKLTSNCPSGTAAMFSRAEPYDPEDASKASETFRYACVNLNVSGVAHLTP